MTKISIIGAGRIGAGIAFNVLNRGLAHEIVFVDIDKRLAKGQSLDITHSLSRNNIKIYSGDYKDIENSDIIVITAGVPRKPGMSRLDLIDINARIIREISGNLKNIGPEAVILTVTNPVDIMNCLVYKVTNHKKEKLIGFGNLLDTSRLKIILAREFRINLSKVETYVMGEHGDSQVPVFSKTKINNKEIRISENKKEEIRKKLKDAAMEVIEYKKGTEFAPINLITDMIEIILEDKKEIVCCSVINEDDMSIGFPVILGKNGIESIVKWELDDYEMNIFKEGENKLRDYCKRIEN